MFTTSHFDEALSSGVRWRLSLLLVNRISFFGKRQLANSCNILDESINKKVGSLDDAGCNRQSQIGTYLN